MWPLIEKRKGDWYSATLSASSLHGIQGYRVRLYFLILCFTNKKENKVNSGNRITRFYHANLLFATIYFDVKT